MADTNNVTLIGRLGKDPELKHTNSGKAVTSFNLAVNDRDKKAHWIPVTVWQKTAEIVSEYARKGSQVCVTGRLQVREYTDRDGNERKAMEVVAETVQLLARPQDGGGSQQSGGGGQQRKPQSRPQPQVEIDPDDIPF